MVNPQGMKNGPESGSFLDRFIPIVLLTAVTVIAFANAWPDALVLDDKFFVGPERTRVLDDARMIFTQDVWGNPESSGALYRPLLLLSFSLENRIFGDWLAGYHLSNIFLHLLVTLLVYGFLRHLLRMTGEQSSSADLYALLAAMIFAIHPVHTEVVNSVFNRSEMMVALAGVGGLWWLLHSIDTRPGKAWFGLAVAYLFGMFSKESAVIIPGLAVALIVLLDPGALIVRIRKCLPVFWLLLPLAVYLAMRVHVLTPPGVDVVEELHVIQGDLTSVGENTLLKAAAVLGESLKVIAWPYPLQLYYDWPSAPTMKVYLAFQLVLISASIILLIRGRPGLAAGMAFYYVSMLPASRIHGLGNAVPLVAERYLYFPSVGLAIVLLFGVRALALRFGPGVVATLGMVALLVYGSLTLDRNQDWASDTSLFENENLSGQSPLRSLVTAHMQAKNFARVVDICDEKQEEQKRYFEFANSCALAYNNMGQEEATERTLLLITGFQFYQVETNLILAKFYVRNGRKADAQIYFRQAVELAENPADKAFVEAETLMYLHSNSREKLVEARDYYEQALRLRPGWPVVEMRLKALNSALKALPYQQGEDSSP